MCESKNDTVNIHASCGSFFVDEVEQPESPFILRFNENANAALFEGDGGAWKLRAVENIRAWLAGKLEGCNVEVIA